MDRKIASSPTESVAPGLVHDESHQRFVRPMAPSDAFVTYRWQGERMVLNHIEIDRSLRGTGVGESFAKEVLTHLQDSPLEIRLTCPYLRHVASMNEQWRRKYAVS